MKPETNSSNTLEHQEQTVLVECEATLTSYQHSPFKAGHALQRIRDGGLYRELFPNFHAYCEQKWDLSRSTADRLIGAHIVYELLAPIGVILENEFQARPLIGLADDKILVAGKLALNIAGGKKLTARHFQLAAERVRPRPQSSPIVSKLSHASVKSVATVLTLVSQAEAAFKQDNYNAVLEALAAIKACLMPLDSRVSEPQPGSKASPEPSCPDKAPPDSSEISKSELVRVKPAATNGKPAPIAGHAKGHTKGGLPQSVRPKPALRANNMANGSGSSEDVICRPVCILLGTTETSISRWNEVPIFVAKWLLSQGHPLPSIACIKRNRLDFPASARIKQLRGDWFIDVGDGQDKLLRNARLLLEKSGQGGALIRVKLTNGATLAV